MLSDPWGTLLELVLSELLGGSMGNWEIIENLNTIWILMVLRNC